MMHGMIICCSIASCLSYSIDTHHVHSRRISLAKVVRSVTAIVTLPYAPPVSRAQEAHTQSDMSLLKEATEVLASLLDNWERATVDCTYADVPRELLEAKNKEKLLEKASEFALFDKSTSVVSCKRTNKIVRDYIGATGKGPLVGIEKRLLKKSVVDVVDPENLDEYFSAVESFSQELARATSLSYTAGVSDFDSINNFAKDDKILNEDGTNLEQARRAIDEANSYLKKALAFYTIDQ